IICGDFNSQGGTAVKEFLTNGCVAPSFREEGYPGVAVTSKEKTHLFGTFADAYE
ncbi:unnamed protein product, partial [Discosporangium mesarthrocarpum]